MFFGSMTVTVTVTVTVTGYKAMMPMLGAKVHEVGLLKRRHARRRVSLVIVFGFGMYVCVSVTILTTSNVGTMNSWGYFFMSCSIKRYLCTAAPRNWRSSYSFHLCEFS